jgi:hypothetical protein
MWWGRPWLVITDAEVTMRTVSRAVPCILAIVAANVASFAQDTPPSITYGGSRTSKSRIELPKGQVAVDDGVAWQGVKVWLSLTWDLIATDEATGKMLWFHDVGAFWNEIGFKEIETSPGVMTWTVELRPGPRAGDEHDLRRYHELKTGKLLRGFEDTPAGKMLDGKPQWSGRWSALAKPLRRLVGSEADWKASIIEPMFTGTTDAPRFGAIDFEKSVVLVIANGDSWNCNGLDATAWEDDRRILVRLHAQSFQTSGPDGGGQRVRPFGIFVLPRRDPLKPVIVQRNEQGLIGGPAIWKELCRFEGLGEAKPESRPAQKER